MFKNSKLVLKCDIKNIFESFDFSVKYSPHNAGIKSFFLTLLGKRGVG